MDGLLDSMGQAVSTIKAATEALESAADFLEQAKAVANQMLESESIYIPQPSGISDDAAIRNTSLFDGRANTQAMIDQIGADALAATAANQFYAPGVDKNDANFGQGQWYLPAIGELMEMYGFDAEVITAGDGTTGANGDNKDKINYTLSAINKVDGNATTLTNEYYWSSSEYGNYNSWRLDATTGTRKYDYKNDNHYVRCFQYLENKFNPTDTASAPQIGDVMYSDLSYGSADDYDGSKTAVGVVTWVSEDGRSAKIINLKDLTFSSNNLVNNFNPDDPYAGAYNKSYNCVESRWYDNITGIEDYDKDKFLATIQETVAESADEPQDKGGYDTTQYTSIISQYDSLIKDASYKGVNLLQEQDLKVTFNEGRTAWLDVLGKDASSTALGLTTLEWNSKEDIEKSIEELTNAMNQIRSMSSELGSYYNIVLSRQDFTENLINVLEEGADKLTLADMDEESANMLALQTRQQLAINSLSLASQAAQGILRLF